MSGHTKGPWYAVGREVRGAGSWTIAQCFHTPDGAVERNARLIAAAPDLLEALDKASAAIQRLHTDVEALMAESAGVYGLHNNGDPAPWDELREGGRFDDWVGAPLLAARNAWHDARAAIARATEAQP